MSYVPQDLAAMKRSFFSSPETPVKCSFPVLLTKVVLFQAARALAFLHHKHIVHRDLKPANILIDPDTFRVQLCDLGSAKQIVSPSSAKNVSYICSRYYRAPELLFGSLHYDAEVDLWSLGCIAAEMLRTGGKVLFKGTTTMDQMAEIFKVLGAPSRQEMFLMNPQAAEAMAVTHEHYRNSGSFPSSIQEHSAVMGEEGTTTSTVDEESDYNHNYNVLKISALPMDKVLSQDASASGVQLIQQLLTYAPQKRMTAVQVLQHEFFADLFTDSQKDSEVVRLPNGKPLPVEMFLLTRQETAYLPSALQEKMTREAEKIKETIVRKK
ncbi:glycogen synthase kinase-3 alpha [Angomonas deanei]|uniref:Protein kinase domain/Protein tyrosine kinase, putative n=1 Tax=Angomonas deanei TaxID=59799 RepID=A0A7G2CEW6_9TRYP|nr:glycogen synthase kinase-3 alpha [Angomonas deanei]CAD2218360.1 Protein kinase domain/Protein tyrosine kinase, putative [Angomonas deanei]|eukprot:EPY20064.1 glycogen synthase kinase-3 alpha [Angomonas deanei]